MDFEGLQLRPYTRSLQMLKWGHSGLGSYEERGGHTEKKATGCQMRGGE